LFKRVAATAARRPLLAFVKNTASLEKGGKYFQGFTAKTTGRGVQPLAVVQAFKLLEPGTCQVIQIWRLLID
jgi:hypothetical protein